MCLRHPIGWLWNAKSYRAEFRKLRYNCCFLMITARRKTSFSSLNVSNEARFIQEVLGKDGL